jgi:hypothetical protein
VPAVAQQRRDPIPEAAASSRTVNEHECGHFKLTCGATILHPTVSRAE